MSDRPDCVHANMQISLHFSSLHILASVQHFRIKTVILGQVAHQPFHSQFSVSPMPNNLQGYNSVSKYKGSCAVSLSGLGSGATRQREPADKHSPSCKAALWALWWEIDTCSRCPFSLLTKSSIMFWSTLFDLTIERCSAWQALSGKCSYGRKTLWNIITHIKKHAFLYHLYLRAIEKCLL